MATDVGGVRIEIPHPDRSSRLLLFFRGILLIPHWFMAIGVGLVALVLLILNYFIVLFTGRPAFFGFLSGTLRYLTRLQAYGSFLTDVYPPFSLSTGDYPITVDVDQPGKIGRWRFFFTYLALIPHIIALYILFIVAAVCTFFGWFAILFTGRFPESLFGVSAAAIRYQARVNAYMYLISGPYPPFSLD